MNGNARPSFSPASEVNVKRASSSASGLSTGLLTCTSVARTGSVGATADASSRALAIPRPNAPHPMMVTRTIDRGMVMARRRQVDDQECRPIGRFSASPAPISETITQTSVRWRATSPDSIGSGSGRSGTSENASIPAATNTIGIEMGTRPSRRGRRAAAKVATPSAAKRAPAPSNWITASP